MKKYLLLILLIFVGWFYSSRVDSVIAPVAPSQKALVTPAKPETKYFANIPGSQHPEKTKTANTAKPVALEVTIQKALTLLPRLSKSYAESNVQDVFDLAEAQRTMRKTLVDQPESLPQIATYFESCASMDEAPLSLRSYCFKRLREITAATHLDYSYLETRLPQQVTAGAPAVEGAR